jgi:diacylglycerol kinase family enzyme
MRVKKRTRVFINPGSSFGKGETLWEKVKDEIRRRIGPFTIEEISLEKGIGTQLKRAYKNGDRTFIAAGGDGTVNLLLNAIMNTGVDRGKIIMGAVGLGSSNDFHKPFRPRALIDGIPVRVDAANLCYHDVLRIDYDDVAGRARTRFCVINASIGITAEANDLFNSRTRLIRAARRISYQAALGTAALATLLTYHDIPCSISVDDGQSLKLPVTNMGVIKNPHFAGPFSYDTPVEPDDGRMIINLCGKTTKSEVIGMIIALLKGRFKGRPKTHTWTAARLSVKSAKPFALEMDGEVVRTKNANFKVLPQAVRCCL